MKAPPPSMDILLRRPALEDTILTLLAQQTGVYIYGPCGSGKTAFVTSLLNKAGYDGIFIDASDDRETALFDSMQGKKNANRNVVQMMQGRCRKLVLVVDELDGLSRSDVPKINTIARLVQKMQTQNTAPKPGRKRPLPLEWGTSFPIICIGGDNSDKKTHVLRNNCVSLFFPSPTAEKMIQLVELYTSNEAEKRDAVAFVGVNLHKFMTWARLQHRVAPLASPGFNISYVQVIRSLLRAPMDWNQHSSMIPESDRATIGLIWHENLPDALSQLPQMLDKYMQLLESLAFADILDQAKFVHQAWVLDEMAMFLKIIHTQYQLHQWRTKHNVDASLVPIVVRYTKVITQYSMEKQNTGFWQKMCETLRLDKRDLLCLFMEFANTNTKLTTDSLVRILAPDTARLAMNRMNRFLTPPEVSILESIKEDSDDDEEEEDDDASEEAEEEEGDYGE
jgi:hypothetical protein